MKNKQNSDDAICLFDGVCILCSSSVRFILRHEAGPSIRFISLESDHGKNLAEKCDVDPARPDTFVFIEGGKTLRKSDAVIAIANHLKGFGSLLKLLRFMPKPIRDSAYDLVATNRYRWFGSNLQCIVPDPATKHRFEL